MTLRDDLRLAGAASLCVLSLAVAGGGLAVLLTPDDSPYRDTRVLTLSRPSFPGERFSFVASCYEAIKERNAAGDGWTLRDAVEEAVTGGYSPWDPPRPPGQRWWGTAEKCVALAGLPTDMRPLPVPEQPPPEWLRREAQRDRDLIAAQWRWRIVWMGSPRSR